MSKLTDAEVDELLERYDQTEPNLKRQIVAALIVRQATARKLLQAIVDDASPCTSGCSRLVDESLIERAEELLKSP